MYFADFETSYNTQTKEAYVYLGHIKSYDNKEAYTFLSINEMFEWLFNRETKNIITVWFHNLSWDGEFLIWWLVNNEFTPTKAKKLQRGEFNETTTEYGSRYQINVNYKGQKIKFLCSYKLLPFSVHDLGDSIGAPKGEIDYLDNIRYETLKDVPEDVLKYVERDVDIVTKSYNNYGQDYELKTTASATSWANFKKWYFDKYGKIDYKSRYDFTGDLFREFKSAYWGGLCLINTKYVNELIECDGSYIDVNSFYPSIFVDDLLPYGLPQYTKPIGCDYVTLVDAIITNVKLKDPNMIPHLHNWSSKAYNDVSYISETTEILNVMYVKDEWDEIVKSYDFEIIKYDEIYFKADRRLSGYISELSDLKIKASENLKKAEDEGNQDLINKYSVEKDNHKRVLNSFYGSWGKSPFRYYKRLVFDTNPEVNKLRYHYGDYYYEIEADVDEKSNYLPVAIWITAMCRTKLIRAIRNNLEYFYYCDTDSMILSCTVDNIKGVELDDVVLGKWKLEMSFTHLKYLKPKCYICYNSNKDKYKYSIAGMSKQNQKELLNFDNFYTGSEIANGKKQKKKVKGGCILIDTSLTL